MNRATPRSQQDRAPARNAEPPRYERRHEGSREALRRRVRSEFDEMHGLSLTLMQAQRLLGLRGDVCVRVLDELKQLGFLVRGGDGRYRRSDIR